jgi:hypothetical protein
MKEPKQQQQPRKGKLEVLETKQLSPKLVNKILIEVVMDQKRTISHLKALCVALALALATVSLCALIASNKAESSGMNAQETCSTIRTTIVYPDGPENEPKVTTECLDK